MSSVSITPNDPVNTIVVAQSCVILQKDILPAGAIRLIVSDRVEAGCLLIRKGQVMQVRNKLFLCKVYKVFCHHGNT